MAATFVLKLGGVDLSSYLRVNPDDQNPMDPQGQPWIAPAFSDTPFSDGQVLISTTVQNREQMWPLFLSDPTNLKDQLHALIQSIQNASAVRPLVIEWRDDGASFSTFFDVTFIRFEPDFNFRRSQHGYAAGVLHAYTSGYGHTGSNRVAATANDTGIFLSVPIGSVAGDAPALMVTNVFAGSAVPSLGRIVAVAPITNPSYAPQVLAASLTDLQTHATLVNASGAEGSQYIGLPISPTGGASGVAFTVPLPNPTIAGGDNRILAVVKSGIDSGVGIYAQDPFGNSLGATAVASMSQGWGLVDLGVCRLPTTGFPTLPKISVQAGGIWASGAAGPLVLASPAGLAVNEVFVLPDKNLALLFESAAGATYISKDTFPNSGLLPGTVDAVGNPWSAAFNNAHQGTSSTGGFATGAGLTELPGAVVPWFQGQAATLALIDADHLGGIQSDSMFIKGKVAFASPGLKFEEVRLFKDIAPSSFVQARLAASGFLSIESATGAGVGNLLASIGIATFVAGAKYQLSLRLQGNSAIANLSKDDGNPVFLPVTPSSVTQASVGASNVSVGGAGAPALAMTIGSTLADNGLARTSFTAWEVDTLFNSNLAAVDRYTIDGINADSYRTSQAGVFAGNKLVNVQRGAFPKMQPSTTSLAVICAPFDQGPANDGLSAVVSIRERYTYGR